MDTPPGDTRAHKKGGRLDLVISVIGATMIALAWVKSAYPLGVFGLMVAGIFYGRWKQHRWSDWVALGLGVMCAAFLATMLALRGFDSLHSSSLVACLIYTGLQVKKIQTRRRAARIEKCPMTSLVIWDRAPRPLDSPILAQIISSVWPGDYTRQDDDSDFFVVGSSPLFMVKAPFGMFMIHNQAQPYMSNVADAAEQARDLRTRRAIEEHQAWLSVDLMGDPFGKFTADTVYREIGRLIAELAGPDTIGLFHPDSHRFFAWSPGLSGALAAGDGLQALRDRPLAPVLPVSTDDKEMAAAVAKARRRWPEFVTAFSRRHPEHLFSIKAALTVGGATEHIWINVDQLDDDVIRGRLGNAPVNLGDYKLDDPVTVAVADVEDWMYLLSDKPIGGFTVDVVTKAMRK